MLIFWQWFYTHLPTVCAAVSKRAGIAKREIVVVPSQSITEDYSF
ncbi:MAG: hypothetical protein AABX12_03300 [Nanoarchaeota archaeon]